MGFTAAFVAVSVIGISEQKKRDKKVARAQNEAREVETAERANQARRSRREQIREARLRQAEIENTAAISGQTGSSAAIAAGSSLQAKLGSNTGSIQEALAFGGAKSAAEQGIFDANRKSGIEILAGGTQQVLSFAK